MALADGADEIDIVIPVGAFLSGDYETMCEEIMELKETLQRNTMLGLILIRHFSHMTK